MGFLDAPTPVAFAHRGYAPDGCENSMAAFAAAVELGYRYLETDVRATADGVAVAFHDATLQRVTDARGRVAELPWRRVRTVRIRGEQPIPTLADVLSAWPQVRVNIDVKAENAIEPTIEAIRRTEAVERVCVGSFSGARLGAMRRAFGPRLCTALGPREALALRMNARANRPRSAAHDRSGPRCVQVPARLGVLTFADRRLVDAAHELGMPVHVWTVNDRSEMIGLLEQGVDGLMTDAAPTLRDLLLERGQWHAAERA